VHDRRPAPTPPGRPRARHAGAGPGGRQCDPVGPGGRRQRRGSASRAEGGPPTAGLVAKSAVGLGAAEVDRLELSEDDVRSILHAEVTAHLQAAEHLRSVGQAARVVELQAQVAALRPFLDTTKG
jgi:hypothetical protein